jgi:transposase
MGMRGSDAASGALFSYVDMEARVPATHPLRTIRTIVNEVLTALDTEFEALYEGIGRQSVAPERLLRASLLQAFYSVRSERQLMEQINYNLLFRWFVGLGIDDAVWDHSTFSKNRERLLGADVAAKFLAAVLRHPKVTRFLSDEHFSVDGTLVEAWASLKSFRAKDGSDEPPAPGRNGERHFHNEKRSNETHASTTDPDARLYRKGSSQAAKLSYMGHALMENRHGLVIGATLTPATGTAEREAAIKMIVRRSPGARRLDAPRRFGSREWQHARWYSRSPRWRLVCPLRSGPP